MSLLDRLRALRRPISTGARAVDLSAVSVESVELEYGRRMAEIEGLRRSSADVIASRRRLEASVEGLQRAIEKLQAQAKTAAAANQDELARSALRQALEEERRLAGREKVVDGLRVKERELAELVADLQRQVADHGARMEIAKARVAPVGGRARPQREAHDSGAETTLAPTPQEHE
jgi:phage shock protein A